MTLNILVIIATFFFMEFMAWFTHKFLMHGLMWYFHKDHHDHSSSGVFEKNDIFFLIFAVPSWLFIMFGAIYSINVMFYMGFGILFYGIAYFIVHDVIIHQRFKWFSKSNNWYVKGIKRAHKIHHKNTGKEDGKNFGMLLVSYKYFKESNKISDSPILTS
jgi:beta-carotene 3-hydroxylase